MKKRLAVVLAVVMVATSFVGCGSKDAASGSTSSGSSTSGSSEKSGYTIKIGHGGAEGVAMHQASLKFEQLVEEASEGRIQVEVYPNQQLGSDRELIEVVQMGNIQMAIPSTAPIVNFVPEYYLFDIPFAFESREQVFEVCDGPVGQEILDSLSKVGIKGLGVWENGFRDMTCKGEAKTTPDQLKGLKIRTMENDIHLELWRALGANPTPMAFGELYTALQQGTVDAQENPLLLTYEMKFQEVQDTVVETRHLYSPYIVMMNEEFYNGLSDEDKEIIMTAFDEATVYQRELAAIGEDEAREKLRESVDIVELSDEERQVFIEKTKYIQDMVKEKVQNDELTDKFIEAIRS